MKKILIIFLLLFAYERVTCQTQPTDDVKISYTARPNEIEFYIEDKNYKITGLTCSESRMLEPKFIEDNNNKWYGCINLKPCFPYQAKITVLNLNTNNSFNKTISVRTTYSKPSIQIGRILPEQLRIRVEWKTTNPTCISKITLKAEAEGQSKTSETSDVTKTYYDFDDLNPCLTYRINLSITDIDNQIQSSDGVGETLPKDPGNIENLAFSNHNDGKSIKVTWKHPPFKSCVKYYFLQWKCIYEECKPNWYNMTPKLNEYTIENVEGCSEYNFSIGINEVKPNAQGSFKTTFIDPSPLTNFRILSSSRLNTEFSWKVEKHYRCIKHYQLNIFGPNVFEIPNINITENLNVTNYKVSAILEACGNYNVTLHAILNGPIPTHGEVFHRNIMINEERPSEIEDTMVKYIYPTEIVLKFKPPYLGNICVKEYRINCWPKDHSEVKTGHFNRTEKVFTIKNLTSCMEYEVQIIPITYSLKEGDPVVLPITTSPRDSHPELDSNAKATHNSLQLSGGTKDRCEVLFAKFECIATHETGIMRAEQIIQADFGEPKFTGVMYPLSPNSQYECTLRLYNVAGWSSLIPKGLWNTSLYFPEIPTSIETTVISNSTFNVKWLPPKYANGEQTSYNIFIQYLGPSYKLPIHCRENEIKYVEAQNSKLEFNFNEALPYSLYSVEIATANEFGAGKFTSTSYAITKPSASEPVDDFSLVSIIGPEIGEDIYEANITVKWRPPCKSNGILKFYTINISDDKSSEPIIIEIKNVIPNDSGYIYFSYIVYHPEYNYTFKLSVAVHDVIEMSEEKIIQFTAPAGIPEPVKEPEKLSSVDSYSSKNPKTSALVKFSKKIFKSNMGEIIYAALLISEMSCQNDPELIAEKYDMSNGWPKTLKSYNDVKDEECVSQYQTTPIQWQPFASQGRSSTYNLGDDNNDNEVIEYVIGNGNDCENLDYCNGPLKPNTKYKMILRTFTKNGFRDSVGIDFKTDEIIQFSLILSLIISVLMIAFFLGFIYLWIIKRRMNRQSLNGIEDSVGDVSAKNFLLHYSKLSAKDKVQREFKDLAVVAQDVCVASTISKYNESKNRYSNIYPYEKNRVILNIDLEGSDYINASFINGYRHRKEYIATQGPKPESFIDFWKMIIEYNVKVIVMVTQFVEGNVIKCHQYFPMINGKEMKFGNNITILCRSQTDNEIYERRELTVKHNMDEVQTVIHYLFKRWPDHDVPSDPNELITFVKRVKSERMPSRSPIVVHCSAGVGRTGTFIALDLIIKRIKNECKINIYETVKSLRFQRMKMVQSIHQYQFLYNCTLVLVKRKYENFSRSKTAKLFFMKPNSSLFQNGNGNNDEILNCNNNNNNNNNNNSSNGVNKNRLNNIIGDKKLKNNLSNSSIISNGTIKGGGYSSSTSGFSKGSRSSFNPNDIESVM
ncbi:receptor-type tyrosine-protein phosphatase eta isoform X2 [Condylostylus longicornis]|uniref:receptor-type tyrosine-protein phosphatase eta isoform X2 n=1 Tax=Condylostylus longicornis TaxID=2530218 RepID=UPI00244DA8F0|nr:receptor-type tyrosine-protein phosphatase eta isoform X2 [Condylostylus longicornis]